MPEDFLFRSGIPEGDTFQPQLVGPLRDGPAAGEAEGLRKIQVFLNLG